MSDTLPHPATESTAVLIDVRELAAMLCCSTRHVYRLVDAGRIPRPIKLGALIRWKKILIEEWLAAGCPAMR